MRELDRDRHTTYVIDDKKQENVYLKLAAFVMTNPGCLVEVIAPHYACDGDYYYLVVTVAT